MPPTDTAIEIDFKARPIAVVSHPRSGTHLTIDGLRHFFVETYRKQRMRQAVHDLYVNLDRLDPTHPFASTDDRFRQVFEQSAQRVLIKTHCTTEIDQVGETYRPFADAVLAGSDVVYVVRDVRPVLASFMALRPLKYPDSPTDIATFLRTDMDGMGPPAVGWAAHVSGWLDRPGVHVMKFEDMRRDYEGTMAQLGQALGLTSRNVPIRIYPKPKSILENKIRRILGRQWSSSIDNLRMQIATPKWREVMTADDLDLIREQAGAAMERLGYEWA